MFIFIILSLIHVPSSLFKIRSIHFRYAVISEVLSHGNSMFGDSRSRKHEGGLNIGTYSKINSSLKFTRISFIP